MCFKKSLAKNTEKWMQVFCAEQYWISSILFSKNCFQKDFSVLGSHIAPFTSNFNNVCARILVYVALSYIISTVHLDSFYICSSSEFWIIMMEVELKWSEVIIIRHSLKKKKNSKKNQKCYRSLASFGL